MSRPRSNWDTPFFLSPFNSRTIYFAGDRVYKSVNRGKQSKAISERIGLGEEGTATEIAESPRSQGLLWAGTDDGALRMTRDGGRNWTDLTEALRVHLPDERPLWVSSICLSRYESSRAYVAVDGHRVGDKQAYVFVSEDNGKTFESLAGGLPEESVHVVLEDSKNRDLLYVGTEMGLYVSIDRGKRWQRLGKPFPTVAVRDLDIQERDQHLILATHGRSVWALDIRPLRELTTATRKKDFHLVSVADVLRLPRRSRSKQGHRHFAVPNPPQRAEVYYWLGGSVAGPVTVEITDVLGKVLFEKKVDKPEPGLGRVDWNLMRARRGVAGAVRRAVARFGGRRRRASVPAGTYAARLRVGDRSTSVTFAVEDDKRPLDVSWPRPPAVGEGGSLLEQLELDEGEEGDGGDAEKGGRIR